jgi:hypothetical protein
MTQESGYETAQINRSPSWLPKNFLPLTSGHSPRTVLPCELSIQTSASFHVDGPCTASHRTALAVHCHPLPGSHQRLRF